MFAIGKRSSARTRAKRASTANVGTRIDRARAHRALRRFWPLVVSAALALGAASGRAQATNDAVTNVAELSWLAGQWRGTTPAGRTIETTYTTPEGGVLLGTSKEYTPDGRCVFFDLEHFAMKDGVLTLTPHPAGKRSRDSFPLATFDRAARRATFVNRAHDWPQQFVYERISDERLLITLSGPDNKGSEHMERFELQRAR